jgi:DNA-binding SARP family transcriptional activator
MARLSLQLLGGFRAWLGPGRAVRLPTRKAEALVAYLAIPAGQSHARDKLASLLWGERSDSQARASLRQTLLRVRRVVGAGESCVRVGADGVALDPAVVGVDVTAFEQAVATASPEALARAAALYRGDLLAGLAVAEPPFEDWLLAERERLRELALEALARLLAEQRAAHRPEVAVQTALQLATLDPLQETVHRTLMRLYLQLGRRGMALRQYQRCVTILRRELDVEPEPETQQLYQHVLRARTVSAAEPSAQPAPPAELPPGDLQSRAGLPAADTPLIGRDGEVLRLRELLGDLRGGRGTVVAIEGEAGIGKSRLLAELIGDAAREGARVLLGRSHESEQILPFGPWVDAFRSGGMIRDDATLARLDPAGRAELARLFPELARPGLPGPSDDVRRLFESLSRLLEAAAATTPVVVLLEDVHWADEMSLRLLAFVGRRVASRPVLVGVTARQEELADAPALRRILVELDDAQRLTRLPLGPLPRADTLALMHALLGPGRRGADASELGAHVWALSEGNPFVVREVVGALGARATGGPWPRAVPDRVRAVIARRLEALDARSREVAAVAAVIGRAFTFTLLRRAAGVGEAEAAEAVEELVRRQVFHHVGDRFDFTHDRVREVIYDALLPPRRTLLHRAVGRAIEAEAESLEPHILGVHYLRGEVWEKAVTCMSRAGASAIEHSAYREAAECLEQAIAALGRLPAACGSSDQAIDLRLDLARPTLYQLGHVKRAAAVLEEAHALARGSGDEPRLGRIAAHLVFCYRALGRKREAVDAGQRALEIARRRSDLDIEVPANTSLGQVFHDQGEYRKAEALFRRNIELLVGELALQPFRGGAPRSIHARTCLVSSLAELGAFDEAQRWADEAVGAAHALDQPHGRVVACAGAGHLLLRRGDWSRAVELLEPALTIARTAEVAVWFPRIASTLGAVYVGAGRVAEGRRLLEEALERTLAQELMHQRSLILAWLGEAALAGGDAREADAMARRSLELARQHDERGHAAGALRLLGEVRRRADPGESARCYREALGLASRLGMRPLVAHALAGLGTLGDPTTPRAERRAQLESAIAMFREMGMAWWLAWAEAFEK